MIAWSDVVNLASELSTFPAPAQATIISQAYLRMDASAWGPLLDTGAAWLAAHLATIANRKGKPGAPTGYRVGSVSSSWALVPVQQSRLDTTSYGQEFRRMIDENPLFRAGVGRRSAGPSFGSTVTVWQPSTVYAVGNVIQSNRNIYTCTEVVGAGESAPAGTPNSGPIGVGINIPDFQTPGTNGVFWAFLGTTGGGC